MPDLTLTLGAAGFCALLTVILWFPDLGTDALWGDEVLSLRAVQNSLMDLVRERYEHAHSPVYFILLKLWLAATTGGGFEPARDEWLARLPSLLMMAGAGALIVAAALRTWGTVAALFAAFLWSCTMIIGQYAVEARPYALLILCIAVVLWANTQALLDQGNSRRFRLVSATGSVGAAAAMPLGVIPVVLMEVSIFATQRFRDDREFRLAWLRWRWLAWLVVAGITVVLGLAIAAAAGDSWTDDVFPFGLYVVLDTLRRSMIAPGAQPWWVLAAGSVVAAFAVKTVFKRRPGDVAIVVASLLVLFPLAMVAMSTVTSLLVVRYFLPATPALVLLSAAGMAAAPLKRASNLLGVAAVLILAIGAIDYRDKPARMDFFPMMRFAESHDLQFGDAFSLNSGPVEPGLFYLGDRFTSLTRASLDDLGSARVESAPLWIFAEDWTSGGDHGLARIRKVMPGTIVCGFKTRSVVAYVAVRERGGLPPALNACEDVQVINP